MYNKFPITQTVRRDVCLYAECYRCGGGADIARAEAPDVPQKRIQNPAGELRAREAFVFVKGL